MSSMSPPDPPKRGAIIPVYESGRDYKEGDAKPNPIKWYKVFCPRCRAQPGEPCYINMKRRQVDYRMVCIARTILFEAFELGSVNEFGLNRSGQTYRAEEG